MRRKSNNSLPRTQKIICIKTGAMDVVLKDGTVQTRTGDKCPIELYETYTTPGPVVGEDGFIDYPINEFGGEEMMAQRFVTYRAKKSVNQICKTSKPTRS